MTLFTETVTLLAREVTGVDEYGNDVVSWTSSSSPAWLDQRNGMESTDAREQSVANMWLFLPLEVQVDAVDKVVWDGREWHVDGEPGRQPPGFILEGYQVMALRKVTG